MLCKAIAILDSFSLYCLGLYALNFYFAYSLRLSRLSSGLLVFTHLGSIYLIAHQQITDSIFFIFTYCLFTHTTALLIDLQSLHMSALCHVIPYLYYSALISLYLSLSLNSYTLTLFYSFSSEFLCLTHFKICLLEVYIIRIALLQGNYGYGYFLST